MWNTAGRFPTDRAALVPLAIQPLGGEQMRTVSQNRLSATSLTSLTCGYVVRGTIRSGRGPLYVRALGVRAARVHGRARTARAGAVS